MNEAYEPEITNVPDFAVIGIKYRGKNEADEVRRLWEQFTERRQEVQQATAAAAAFGLMDNFDEASGEFDYLAGVEVEAVDQVPEGMEAWEVMAQNYAVFATTLRSLQDTWRHAYEDWMPQSNYRRTPGPEFERYGEGFDPADTASELDLYIPVEPLAGGE